jgi:uncharacterized protein (TIGR04255 family)
VGRLQAVHGELVRKVVPGKAEAMTENAPPASVPDRHYEHPPIVEALCEIYFAKSDWDDTTPGLFYNEVGEEYPDKSALRGVGLNVRLGQERSETQQVDLEPRMKFARKDKSRLLQLGRDLLVVNQLLPYPSFETWREEVLRTLGIYRRLASPAGIERLGVRYINIITVPGDVVTMEKFFRVYPAVPLELGGVHGPFMLQVVMRPYHLGHELALTLGMSPPQRPDTISFLLSLHDVFRVGGRDAFGEVESLLDSAHQNIVYTFENIITNEARKLFGEVAHA